MKKVIGIPLLLLANFTILAYAIIPHHHTEGLIVTICNIFSFEEANHGDNEHHYHEGDQHQHSGHSSTDDCPLNELYLPCTNLQSSSSSYSTNSENSNFHPEFPLIYMKICLIFTNTQNPQTPIKPKPYNNTYNSCINISSLGLRAPPLC
ncbi:hypothetical protein [Bacteroides sp.]|uniref:hypothetical protein n=1 Tax=Bacteroides sp. TaxID=29523 RepID=UPI0025BDE164|nr:hypothetical protein [Bacteroides sp.]